MTMHILDRPPHVGTAVADVLPGANTIGDAIAHWARRQPTQPALLDLERTVSWAQLHACVEATGQELARFGLAATHRVGLVVPEGLAGAQLVLGLCCHCLLVPINPALTPSELVDAAAQTRLDALVVPQPLVAQLDRAGLDGVLVIEATVAQDGGPPALGPLGSLRRPAPIAPAGAAILLRSSGTTGTPKLVPVTHRNMLAMAAKMASATWFGLGQADRAVATLPLYYAAGLKNLLLVPAIVGGSMAFPPSGRGIHLADWLPRLKPTFLAASPASLAAVLERLPADLPVSSLRFVMCGASYLPKDLREAAQARFGVPVVEYYGLSEAGVMAANPVAPGQARPGTVGRVFDGELRIVDASGRTLPPGDPGEILVTGPSVCPGYLLPDGSLSNDVRSGELRTGDVGALDADGFLRILGRHKEVINRGGEKVFPYEVEKALLEHADVLEAAVYGVPHPRLGQGVAAAVVLKPERHTAPREISAWLGQRLAPYKMPRGLRVVPDLPKGKTGKVLRGVLAEQHHERPATRELPDSLLQEELLSLWRRMLATEEVGMDDDFFEMGGDSLLATDLLLEIERLTGASTEGWDLSSLTVNDVTRAVLRTLAQGGVPSGELLSQVRNGQGAPLFFCHGDIASRGIYAHRLMELLPSSNPVWLLNSPERYAGLSIEAAASAYLDEVLRVAGSPASVYLAGWCNAGLVAWHLAHLLAARGVRVLALFLIETPSLNGDGGLRRVAQTLRGTGAWVPGRAGRFLREEAMRGVWALCRKSVPEFAAALKRRAVGTGGPSGEGALDSLHQVAVLYYQRIARYVPMRLDVPVTCFVAQEGAASDTDPRRWRKLAPVVRQVSIPGSHYSAVVRHRATLAARLAEGLEHHAQELSRRAAKQWS
jgi:acyl-CoA synthetase (AMP-forming)/AMP-acid ligase II/thioesterase domain-containing protein